MSGQMSLDDIRETLTETVMGLKVGGINPAHANAISNATGKILTSVKLEMEYAKLTGRKALIGLMDGPSGVKRSR